VRPNATAVRPFAGMLVQEVDVELAEGQDVLAALAALAGDVSGDAGASDDPPEITSGEESKRFLELLREADEWLGVRIRERREGEY
jgi:hypothetical protein